MQSLKKFETLHAAIGFILNLLVLFLTKCSHFNAYFMTNSPNTMHVCTYLNTYSMVIPCRVTKFNNLEMFEICVKLWTRHLPRLCIKGTFRDHRVTGALNFHKSEIFAFW